MSYYMGDYYRGDYYRGRRGDPFSIGGLFKGIGKTVGGFVGGLVTGGPLGAVTGAAQGAIGSIIGKSTAPTPSIIPPPPSVSYPGVGSPFVSEAGIFNFSPSGAKAGPGSVKDPGLSGVISRILPGGATGYHKRRRMNVTNPRALRRAIRRVSGFGKIVKRIKRAVGQANTAVGNRHRSARRGRR